MKKSSQPARLSYFFGPGYKDVKKTIKLIWELNAEDAKKYYIQYDEAGLMSVKGLFNFSRALSIMIFGSLFSMIISAVIILVLVLFFLPVYLLFSLVWLIDRIYLVHNKISVACSHCHSSYRLPIYECECGQRHDDLTPGKYGIWKRECVCGRKLSTAFFNGRKELKAICPVCLSNGKLVYLNEKETRPITIPVVGGRSVGKTAFITAFSKKFIDEIASDKGFTTEFYDRGSEIIYQKFSSSYMSGSTVMTQKVDSRTNTNAIDFSFFVNHEKLKPSRLFHIYDIAGEIFTNNDEGELPKHFTYSQGIIFMIDPFSLPEIRNNYQHMLDIGDRTGIGYADVITILDSFIIKLKSVTGTGDEEMSKVPLAVVISKTDSPGLCNYFSKEKLNKFKKQSDDKKMTDTDAIDILCRQFLRENGAGGFVNSLEMKFKNAKFFSISSIGHSRNKGAYKPIGVLEPVKWICKCSDRSFYELWYDIE